MPMDLIDDIRSLASKIEKSRHLVITEEATKNAFVMPFIALLGYDVFDPTEVTPELTADVGLKRGEKIDYAIMRDQKPIILIECKCHGGQLSPENASQLYRYFSVTEARVAVLTDGIEYKFYSDLDAPNKMDSKPFLSFSILDFPEAHLPELKKFSKAAFDLDTLLSSANELKYLREIKSLLGEQLITPSEEFVKFCAVGIGVPRMTQAVRDQFTSLTRKALAGFVNDQVSDKLKTALGSTSGVSYEAQVTEAFTSAESKDDSAKIVTTDEEIEGFYAIKAILRDVVDVRRIFHRDQQSYFSIILDNNNRKPVCRLHFNAKTSKYIGLFDEAKNEGRFAVKTVDDLYAYAERLRETVKRYDVQS